MSDLATTKFHDSEISKASDFNFTADSPLAILNHIFDGGFDDVVNSFVIAGMQASAEVPPDMNIRIGPGLAYTRVENKLLHLAVAASVSVDVAHDSLDRVDTLEMRYLEEDIDKETRAFRDPATGAVTNAEVFTKTRSTIEFQCRPGTPGAGVAPEVDLGWTKLAEVNVPALTTQILAGNIKGLTAQNDGDENALWTAQKTLSFYLGSVESLKNTVLAHIANNSTDANTVHGIRQGAGNGLDSDFLDGHHETYFAKTTDFESMAQTMTEVTGKPSYSDTPDFALPKRLEYTGDQTLAAVTQDLRIMYNPASPCTLDLSAGASVVGAKVEIWNFGDNVLLVNHGVTSSLFKGTSLTLVWVGGKWEGQVMGHIYRKLFTADGTFNPVTEAPGYEVFRMTLIGAGGGSAGGGGALSVTGGPASAGGGSSGAPGSIVQSRRRLKESVSVTIGLGGIAGIAGLGATPTDGGDGGAGGPTSIGDIVLPGGGGGKGGKKATSNVSSGVGLGGVAATKAAAPSGVSVLFEDDGVAGLAGVVGTFGGTGGAYKATPVLGATALGTPVRVYPNHKHGDGGIGGDGVVAGGSAGTNGDAADAAPGATAGGGGGATAKNSVSKNGGAGAAGYSGMVLVEWGDAIEALGETA